MDRPLGDCSRISEVEPPSKILDTKEPKWKEVLKVVKEARAVSVPGPSGISLCFPRPAMLIVLNLRVSVKIPPKVLRAS